ncbi:MAG: hypothetical protein Q9183_003410 [Haloplaca sp. 2 TL-2023]
MGRPRKRRKESGQTSHLDDMEPAPPESQALDRIVGGMNVSSANNATSHTSQHSTGPDGDTGAGNSAEHAHPLISSNLAYDDSLPAQIPDSNRYDRIEGDNPHSIVEGPLINTTGNDGYLEGPDFPMMPGVFDASCSCLKKLRSTLEDFQSLPPLSFPSSRGLLIKATALAREVVRCPCCPVDYPSALQNLMALTTLLPLVVHEYARLLRHIQDEVDRGCKITYRIGDLSPSTLHLHTGTADCPMGFNVELDPEEWASIAKRVVKQDVFGNPEDSACLMGVVEELEQRQQIWHLLQPYHVGSPDSACHGQPPHCSGEGNLCLQLIGQTRKAVAALKL